MLPILNLQPGELLKFDNSLNNMQLLPQDAVVPEAEFGDLLELRLSDPPVIEFQPGQTLPESGNALPQSPLPPEPMLDAEALAGQLQPTEPLPSAQPPDMSPSVTESPVLPVETGELVAPAPAPGADAGGVPITDAEIPLLQPDSERAPAAAPVSAAEFVDTAVPPAFEAPIAKPEATTIVPPAADRGAQTTAPAAALRPDPAVVHDAARSTNPLPASPAAVLPDQGEVPVAVTQPQPQPQTRRAVEAPMPGQPVSVAEPDTAAPVVAERSQPRATEFKGEELAVLGRTAPSATASAPRPVLAQPAGAPLPPAAPTFAVDTPVQDMAWGERVGERVLLMASNQMKAAEIRLSPAELGPLRVQVSVDDGAASVVFHAQHAVTRDAIEQALPRLREMFVENGLSLGQATVGDQGVAQQGSANRDGDSGQGTAAAQAEDPSAAATIETDPASRQVSTSNSLVDTYA